VSARAGKGAPPAALTGLHLLVFGGAAVAAVQFALPEWRQLGHVLFRPFSLGTPPNLVVLAGSFGCVALGALLVFRVVRRQSVPLWISLALLVCVGMSFVPVEAPEHRTWAAADKTLLLTVSRLQRQMVQTLQTDGGVPVEKEKWAAALTKSIEEPLPIRAKGQRLTYTLTLLPLKTELPNPTLPGTVVARVSPDGVAFALNAVGVNEAGAADYLRDEAGEVLTLRGLFNPTQTPSLGGL
jgi:hypothetical protein